MDSPNPETYNCWGNVMPTQILLDIFTRLSPKALIKCREVCARWKIIVDDLKLDNHLWHEHYKADFKRIYESEKLKTRPQTNWFYIYRSLSLWSKYPNAEETRDELVLPPTIHQEIRDFQIIKDVIAVHKHGSITYHDIETLNSSNKEPITGEYLLYAENDYAIVTSSYQQLLYIVRKVISNSKSKTQVTIPDVQRFILVNQKVYYSNSNNEIYICYLSDEDMTIKFIEKVDETILSFGFSLGRVHVLTCQHSVYTVKDQKLLLSCSLDLKSNLLHHLNIYGLLDSLDWRIYLKWVYILNRNVQKGLLRDMVFIHSYGDVFFIGTVWGLLHVYYAPYSSGELDLINLKPVKQYNFNDCNESALTMCPILQIDVLEVEEGHKVIVAMPRKIVVLNIIHNFK